MTLDRAVTVERGACALCHERADCARVPVGPGFALCPTCLLSCAAVVASKARTVKKRPHPKRRGAPPCTCMECIAFDEGQRGEAFSTVVLERDGGAPKAVTRWALLEVDDVAID
jgi:hypothetical protein